MRAICHANSDEDDIIKTIIYILAQNHNVLPAVQTAPIVSSTWPRWPHKNRGNQQSNWFIWKMKMQTKKKMFGMKKIEHISSLFVCYIIFALDLECPNEMKTSSNACTWHPNSTRHRPSLSIDLRFTSRNCNLSISLLLSSHNAWSTIAPASWLNHAGFTVYMQLLFCGPVFLFN